MRELYIGSIAHVDGNRISGGFDYMALGHLHMAQKAGGSEIVRYSGSPIPMGFAESTQTKKVIVADFQGSALTLMNIPYHASGSLLQFPEIQKVFRKGSGN